MTPSDIVEPRSNYIFYLMTLQCILNFKVFHPCYVHCAGCSAKLLRALSGITTALQYLLLYSNIPLHLCIVISLYYTVLDLLKMYEWLVYYLLQITHSKQEQLYINEKNDFNVKNNIQVYHARPLSLVFCEVHGKMSIYIYSILR